MMMRMKRRPKKLSPWNKICNEQWVEQTQTLVIFCVLILENTDVEIKGIPPFRLIYTPGFISKPGALIGELKKFSEHFKSVDYTLLSLVILIPFYIPIQYALNESYSQSSKFMPQYDSSFVFIQQLMPLLSYALSMILITKTGYNFPVLMFSGLAILSGFFNTIFSWGSSPSEWEIVTWDLLARFSLKGLTFFMIFWSTNHSKFGGKNGVLGVFHLCVLYFFLGFSDWAWHKWD